MIKTVDTLFFSDNELRYFNEAENMDFWNDEHSTEYGREHCGKKCRILNMSYRCHNDFYKNRHFV